MDGRFGSSGDPVARRGLDEALACQDLLAPAPAQPTAASRIAAVPEGVARVLAGWLPRRPFGGVRRDPAYPPPHPAD